MVNLHYIACRLVGKVAADNSHKWVFRDTPNEGDPSFISSWNVTTEPVSKFTTVFFLQSKCKDKIFFSSILIFPYPFLHAATKGMGVSIQIRHTGCYFQNI